MTGDPLSPVGAGLLPAGTAATFVQQQSQRRAPPDLAPDWAEVQTKAQARRAAEDFESFFLRNTLENMFAGVEPDPVFGGGAGEKMYKSMQLDAYATEIAKAGGIGLADQVYREILKLQGIDQDIDQGIKS